MKEEIELQKMLYTELEQWYESLYIKLMTTRYNVADVWFSMKDQSTKDKFGNSYNDNYCRRNPQTEFTFFLSDCF